MTIKNQYNLEVDIKNSLVSVIPTFKIGDTNKISIKVLDNGEQFNIENVDKVSAKVGLSCYSVDLNTEIINIEKGRLIVLDLSSPKLEKGTHAVEVVLHDGDTKVTLPEFKVVLH